MENKRYNNNQAIAKRKRIKSRQVAEEIFLKDEFRRKTLQATLTCFCFLNSLNFKSQRLYGLLLNKYLSNIHCCQYSPLITVACRKPREFNFESNKTAMVSIYLLHENIHNYFILNLCP